METPGFNPDPQSDLPPLRTLRTESGSVAPNSRPTLLWLAKLGLDPPALNTASNPTSTAVPMPTPDPTPNSPSVRRTSRNNPATKGPSRKPRKRGPQSHQGKRIHDLFGAPLKIYNPRRDARQRAQQEARKKGATPAQIEAAGCRKVRRSHPGSTFQPCLSHIG